MPVVNCYKASIEKTSDGFRIYLFSSYENGGDTEILITGDLEVKREQFRMYKGLPITSGWKPVQISVDDPKEKVI